LYNNFGANALYYDTGKKGGGSVAGLAGQFSKPVECALWDYEKHYFGKFKVGRILCGSFYAEEGILRLSRETRPTLNLT